MKCRGLKKGSRNGGKRIQNKNLGVEFSQKTWQVLAESWVGADGLAMTKIIDLYGLYMSDLDMSKSEKLTKEQSTPRCEPTN